MCLFCFVFLWEESLSSRHTTPNYTKMWSNKTLLTTSCFVYSRKRRKQDCSETTYDVRFFQQLLCKRRRHARCSLTTTSCTSNPPIYYIIIVICHRVLRSISSSSQSIPYIAFLAMRCIAKGLFLSPPLSLLALIMANQHTRSTHTTHIQTINKKVG